MFGISVRQTIVEVWYFDRSGAIGASPLDVCIQDHAMRLFRLLTVICGWHRDVCGFIPQFSPHIRWPALEDAGQLRGLQLAVDADVKETLGW